MDVKPLRITDWGRELRLGVTASCLRDLEDRARSRLTLGRSTPLRVVLEDDGTEIDDDDYFFTLAPHTPLMILTHDERWTPYKSNFVLGLAVENEDGMNGGGGGGGSPVEELIWRLHRDLSFFPWLRLEELETLAKMDREEMRGVVPDPHFLEFLQTLCERYLQEKDKGGSGSNGTTNGTVGKEGKTASLLHDPLRLIRLYSKFAAMKEADANGGFFSFSSCGSEESLASLSLADRAKGGMGMGVGGQGAGGAQRPLPTTPHKKQATN